MVQFPLRPVALGLVLLALGAAPAAAQGHSAGHARPDSAPTAAPHAMHSSGWAELDAFHMVMMETWHPAKKTGDLAPIRARAAEMVAAAETWAKSTPPKKCAGEETATTVAKVVTDARALAALVEQNGADDEVKASLSGLHDTFEHVMHGCAGAH